MKKLLTIVALFALAAPAALAAPPDGRGNRGNQGGQDAQNAQTAVQSPGQLCLEQRRAMGVSDFRRLHTTGRGRSALARCVALQIQEVDEARENAAQECRAEMAQNLQAFRDRYGTNPNKMNAFGKCVSGQAAQETAEQQEDVVNAAMECKRERATLGASGFREKWAPVGHPTGANAFGKCVNAKSGDVEEEDDD